MSFVEVVKLLEYGWQLLHARHSENAATRHRYRKMLNVFNVPQKLLDGSAHAIANIFTAILNLILGELPTKDVFRVIKVDTQDAHKGAAVLHVERSWARGGAADGGVGSEARNKSTVAAIKALKQRFETRRVLSDHGGVWVNGGGGGGLAVIDAYVTSLKDLTPEERKLRGMDGSMPFSSLKVDCHYPAKESKKL